MTVTGRWLDAKGITQGNRVFSLLVKTPRRPGTPQRTLEKKDVTTAGNGTFSFSVSEGSYQVIMGEAVFDFNIPIDTNGTALLTDLVKQL